MSIAGDNPFVGLRPFDSDEGLLFFGRQEQTLELLQRLYEHHFVAVVGSSGSGKSSLIRAGLIPRLKAGYLVNERDRWLISIFKPGDGPLFNLAASLLDALGKDHSPAAVALQVGVIREKGADAVVSLLQQRMDAERSNVFILVDQFEELFRFAMESGSVAQKDEATDFVNILLALAARADLPVYVVITMRSDFIGDCSRFFGLPEALNQSQYLVPRLSRVQLKTAIEGPVRLYGGKISPTLSSALLNDVQSVEDELPLLQHLLMRTWDHAMKSGEEILLTPEDYRSVGGIEKALSLHAEEALSSLPPEEQLAAKRMFQALTTTDTGGRKIRHPAHLEELAQLMGLTRPDVARIINHFNKDGRSFLVAGRSSDPDNPLIDISHESLIRQWETLSHWVDQETESAKIYLRLSEAAMLYREGKKDLLTGTELQIALNWIKARKPDAVWADRYNGGFEDAMSFLEKSTVQFEASRKEAGARQKRELRRTRLIALLVAMVACFALALFYFAFKEKQKAYAHYLISEAKSAVKTDPTLALRLAEAASKKFDDPDIEFDEVKIFNENSFYKIAGMHDGSVNSLVYAPDAQHFLSCSDDQTARLWDLNGHPLTEFKGHTAAINWAEFSPDGKIVATASDDSTARLWNLQGHLIRELRGHGGIVNAVTFSPDGKTILTGSADLTARLWDLEGHVLRELRGHKYEITSACFSPDGNSILTSSVDHTARLWDLNGNTLREFKGHKSTVYRAIFTPDGKNVITCSSDQTALMFDLDGNIVQEFDGHVAGIRSVSIARDGRHILTGADDNSARLWDLKGNTLQEFRGHTKSIYATTFSPDGQTILTGGRDKTIRKWHWLANVINVLRNPSGGIISVAFSPDSKYILAGSVDETRMWDLAGNLRQEFIGHSRRIVSVAFTADGSNILTGSNDNTARLWDSSGHSLLEIHGHSASVNAVAFSPDGKRILTGSDDRSAKLWDRSGHLIQVFIGHNGYVTSVAFSPDGKTILTGSYDSTARLWSPDGKLICVFRGHQDEISSVAFSPDGKTLLTGSYDQTARLWSIDGQLIREFKSYSGAIYSVAFSRDGKTILTGADDHIARLWDISGNIIWEFIGHDGTINSVAYSPDGKMVVTGSDDHTIRLWDLAAVQHYEQSSGYKGSKNQLQELLKSDRLEQLSARQKKYYGID